MNDAHTNPVRAAVRPGGNREFGPYAGPARALGHNLIQGPRGQSRTISPFKLLLF